MYQRQGDVLRRVRPVQEFVSPRLGIRFDLSGAEMVVFGPTGRFLTFEELQATHEELKTTHEQAVRRAARLAELSRKARSGQATPDELQELERLEQQSFPTTP